MRRFHAGRRRPRSASHSANARSAKLRIESLEERSLLSVSPIVSGSHDHQDEPSIIPLPPQIHVTQPGSFLTGPTAGSQHDVALGYLSSHAAQLGLTATDVTTAKITSEYETTHNGMRHMYLEQTHQGLDVLSSNIDISVTAKGQVITVGGGFVPELNAPGNTSPIVPVISATTAIRAAAVTLELPVTTLPTVRETKGGIAQAATLTGGSVSADDIPAKLVYVPTADGKSAALAWDFVVRIAGADAHWYHLGVDAASGELRFKTDWVDHASYNVFPLPTESPDDGPRVIMVDPQDPTASPFGWHETNGATGSEFSDTRGNNVFAQEDHDFDDAGGFRPNGGSSLNFDFPLDVTQDPLNFQSAAITNLFFLNNMAHDIHYHYGFDEVAGNFQETNYSGTGTGGDPVQADAQDGADLLFFFSNNANFATPPDGEKPRMQMYLWTDDVVATPPTPLSPNRDGDVDATVVIHEFGHGVSNRLTGGPANSDALEALQSGAMGEGWSDWWGMMFTQKVTDAKMDAYPIVTYSLGQAVTGAGIRRVPYSVDLNTDSRTLDDFDGGFSSSEAHAAGEIWCSALWDLNWFLIDKYGFDPNLIKGYTGPGSAGNILALQLVMDALKLQPANPTFLDARDAILQADLALTGGANQAQIWSAFARRGMGLNADIGTDSDSDVVIGDNSQPTAFDDRAVTQEGVPVVINVLANDLDPDGVNVSSVAIVRPPTAGTAVVDTTTGTVTYTPSAVPVANDSFTYTFKDNLGNTSNVATVLIHNSYLPRAVDDQVTIEEDNSATIDILANDSDPAGALIPSSVKIVTQPTKGTIFVDPNTAVITYIPAPNINGIDTIVYTVKDDDGNTSRQATVTITIVPVNDPPFARDDIARTAVDVPVLIPVLANDFDVDGTIVPASLAIVQGPQHGSYTVNPDGSILYAPNGGFAGGDKIVYTVADDLGQASQPATVSIRVGSPVTFAGLVYADINNNGKKDGNEIGIANVSVAIVKTDSPLTFRRIVQTGADGTFFLDEADDFVLPAGTYNIEEIHPAFFHDGKDVAGTPAPTRTINDQFLGITMPPGGAASGFRFGERGLRAEFVSAYADRRVFFATGGKFFQPNLDLAKGDFFVSFDAGLQGQLSANVSADNGAAQLTLYDNDMHEVAASQPGTSQLDYATSSTQPYFLKISGASGSVNLESQVGAPAPINAVTPPASWHNPNNSFDVNHDGNIFASDVLMVINSLNSLGTGSLAGKSNPQGAFIDVNDDGMLSALDALLIINKLNAPAASGFAQASTAQQPATSSLAKSSPAAATDQEQVAVALAFDQALTELTLIDPLTQKKKSSRPI